MHSEIDYRYAIFSNARILLASLLLGLFILQPQAFAQDVTVRAELSTSTITRDESVVLTITAIGIDAELDASSLGKDFDVVGRSSSRQISTVIGSNNQAVNTSVVTWALELLPKGEGIFTVPAVKVGDLETQLLSLTVNAVPQGAKREVFLESSVDSNTPWVQSQVVMTLRVFQAIDIVDGGLDVPSADDLVVERIGEDIRTREVRDGREYSVTERRFALFPQKSGSITIDPVTLSVTVPAEPGRVRGYFSPTRKLTRSSEAITLDVQARPPSGIAWWLPAQNVDLQAKWQGDPQMAQVDQPLTRTIVMRAEGVLESQLPQISIPAIDGLSLYAEDPKVAMGTTDSGLVSEQSINWALIPQRSGTLTLPAISVEWFNTLTGQIETAELPEETIDVLPSSASGSGTGSNDATNAALVETPDAQVTDTGISSDTGTQSLNSPVPNENSLLASNTMELNERIDTLESSVQTWKILAFLVVCLWLVTTAVWLMMRKRTANGLADYSDIGGRASKLDVRAQIGALYQQLAPMSQIDNACRQGDLLEIKRALLEWCGHQWPVGTPSTLDALQAKLPESVAREKLSQIQLALYSRKGYASSMPSLATDLSSLADDLKKALQQNTLTPGNEEIVNSIANGDDALRQGSSRLPPL